MTTKDRRRINQVSVHRNPHGEVFVFGRLGRGKDSLLLTCGTGAVIGELSWLPQNTFDARLAKNTKRAEELFMGKSREYVKAFEAGVLARYRS